MANGAVKKPVRGARSASAAPEGDVEPSPERSEAGAAAPVPELAQRDGSYVVPIVHAHLPARAVEWGFWGALAGSAVLGAVDPPLAALVGLGVVVARHRRR